MKKYLALFAVITTLNSAAQFSNSPKPIEDTQCYPVSVIQKMLIAAQQKDILQSDIYILEQRIENFQAMIKVYDGKDSINKVIIESYKEQIRIMKDQRAVFEAQLKTVSRTLRRQKRKTFFTAMAGVATTTAAIFLFK